LFVPLGNETIVPVFVQLIGITPFFKRIKQQKESSVIEKLFLHLENGF
jgi:hypothetical protein